MDRGDTGVKGIVSLEALALGKLMEQGPEFVENHPISLRKRLKEVIESLVCFPKDKTQAIFMADHWLSRTTVDRVDRVDEVDPFMEKFAPPLANSAELMDHPSMYNDYPYLSMENRHTIQGCFSDKGSDDDKVDTPLKRGGQ